MGDFSDLLSEAEKLTQDIEGTSELPKVDRSLRQVLEASSELYSRVAQSGAKDIQANLLLGSKGIDLPRIAQKLESISSKKALEAVEPIDDVDLDAGLENEIRNCILGVIEREHQNCFKNVKDQAWDDTWSEWKQEKRKIMNSMVGPSGSFITPVEDTHLIEAPVIGSMFMSQQEALYASRIIDLNRKQARGENRPDLVSYFASAAEEFKDMKVNDMWEIMKYMTVISTVCTGEDAITVRKSKAVVTDLVGQAKKYLEHRYKTYMTNVINENLTIAQRGGTPGTYPLVRSYLAVRLPGGYVGFLDGQIDDRPLWPMVYYCLRSGDLGAALDCLKRANGTQNFPDLMTTLEAKYKNPNQPDIQKLEAAIRFHYKRSIRNESDPFKRIVWAIVGCCDIIDDHSEVARTADDWLWLKLCLVRPSDGTIPDRDDHIDYFDLQRTIIEEYGENHYDAIKQPHLYFQVLALTGQFEAAIEFLSRIERYKVHAVHMAIALHELYMLAGPADYSSPLLIIDPADPKPCRRLNLVRLIMIYVQRFEVNCIQEAINYFFLLHKIYDSDKVNMFMVCICDLAQETRDYARIFGSIQPNGIRTKGALDEFRHPDITVEKTAQMLAAQLCTKGLYEDAIELYDIGNNQTEVLNLLSSLVSQVVSTPSTPGSTRERLAYKIRNMYDRYSREGFRCSASAANNFCNLKDLISFFDQYHAKNYQAALKILFDLKIVPSQSTELDERVNNFKSLSGDICKIIPDVLLATMNIYFAQYQKIKENEHISSRIQDISIDKQLAVIKEQARILTNFTGMLPYRMPGDTNSRLVQMEILMN